MKLVLPCHTMGPVGVGDADVVEVEVVVVEVGDVVLELVLLVELEDVVVVGV